MAVKKSKRRQQHQEAITEFKDWLGRNSDATHQEKFDAFDRFVDSSELNDLVERIAEYVPSS